MRVIILRNTLAPVVTVEMNFLVGGNETPPGFPGMAHAQEHMAFRGCRAMSADQTAAIYAELGGQNNADTQQNITQYFATVPAADLEVALRAQAACLEDVDDSNSEWAQERGAIEQEVARDLSNPTYKFIDRLNRDMFAGTPYAHDPLGTKASFDATTGDMLKSFYRTWYAPGAAILIIVGDVDPAATLDKVRRLFGAIPSHPTPPRPRVDLRPVKSESFTLDSNLPYTLAFIAYRFPGTSSPDFAAAQVLADVLSSQRADLYGMVPAGRALAAEFGLAEPYEKASVGYAAAALPAAADAKAALAEMRKILETYALQGVPEELVTAAKRREVADAEFERNSIPGPRQRLVERNCRRGPRLARRGRRGHPAGDARRRESRRAALSRRGELDHRHLAARAVGATGRHQGLRRGRAGDRGADRTGAAAALGGRRLDSARGAERVAGRYRMRRCRTVCG